MNRVDITYFNWHELLLYGRRDMAAIIILAYAQTSMYNEYSSKTLMKRININHIPNFLFQSGILEQKNKFLQCNYKTKEPQSYFVNSKFLIYNLPVRQKVNYLKALSMRRITDKSNKIPREFFDKVTNTMLLTTDDRYIYFPLESSVSKTSYT